MKFVHIFILFTLVNVSVALDEITKQVIKTNKQMMYVRDNLPEVIQHLVLFENFSMVELAVILTLPESKFDDREDNEVKDDEEDNEVKDDEEDSEEKEDIINFLVNNQLNYQFIAQGKIYLITKIKAPEIDEEIFKNADLSGLGVERRGMTLEAVKILIRAVISGDNENFIYFYDMCRLIGSFKSIRDSPKFVKHASVDKTGFCILKDVTGKVSRYYTDENGIIWELFEKRSTKDKDQKVNSIQSLSEQVKEF